MSGRKVINWRFPYPYREPYWRWRPWGALPTTTMLAVLVGNSSDYSMVQGVNFSGTLFGTLTAPLTGVAPFGITPGDTLNNPYYVEGGAQLFAASMIGGTVLQPTVAQQDPSTGDYWPLYAQNTINYYGGNLYALGGTPSGYGVLRFDATTGNPNGTGSSPTTDPLYLSLSSSGVTPFNVGMSLISVQGQTALVIQGIAGISPNISTGIYACIISGTGTPSLKGPIPYSAFQVSVPSGSLGLMAPCQSPGLNTIYFIYFDGLSSSQAGGLMSVSVTDIEIAILAGSHNVPVTVIAPLGLIPATTVWCVAEVNQQDVVYVAIPGSAGTWQTGLSWLWSIQSIDPATGATATIIQDQPGAASGMCVVTVQVG